MDRRKQILIAAGALLLLALAFFPQWSRANRLDGELERTRWELKLARMEGRLGAALAESLRSNYERARVLMTGFFSELQQTVGQVDDGAQRSALEGVLAQRDEIVTLLARSNPGSTQRLVMLYATFFTATDPAARDVPAAAPAVPPPAAPPPAATADTLPR